MDDTVRQPLPPINESLRRWLERMRRKGLSSFYVYRGDDTREALKLRLVLLDPDKGEEPVRLYNPATVDSATLPSLRDSELRADFAMVVRVTWSELGLAVLDSLDQRPGELGTAGKPSGGAS